MAIRRHLAVLAAALLFGLCGPLAAACVQYAPGDSTRLVAVYPLWWPPGRALAAAGEAASVSGVGGASFVIAAAAARPGLAAALRESGAWLVLDGRAFPACFSTLR